MKYLENLKFRKLSGDCQGLEVVKMRSSWLLSIEVGFANMKSVVEIDKYWGWVT
jgi:hypothetical protein